MEERGGDLVVVGAPPESTEDRPDPGDGVGERLGAAELVLDRPLEVLAADRLPRLLRGPGGEGAPVRGETAERGHRRRQLVISLGDPEIPRHRIGVAGNGIDLGGGGVAASRERA